MIKRAISVLSLTALVLAFAASATAQNVTVQMTGTPTSTTFIGPNAIQDAVNAVGNGGSVNVAQAGTYTSVTLVGGKIYQVKGMVPGVIIQNAGQPAVTANATTPTQSINVKLVNLNMINTSGSAQTRLGTALYAVQGSTSSLLTLDLVDCVLRQTGQTTATGDGLQIASAGASGTTVSLVATNCTFESLTSQVVAGDGHAIRLSAGGNFAKTVKLINCTATALKGQAVAAEMGNRQIYTVKGCTFQTYNQPSNRSTFRTQGGAFSDGVFDFTDCVFRGYGETFISHISSGTALRNKFKFNRCTFDNRRPDASAGKQVVYIRQAGAAGTGLVELYNTLLIGTSGQNLVHTRDATIPLKAYHCTFVNEASDSGRGIRAEGGTPSGNEVYNCIFQSVGDAVEAGTKTLKNLNARVNGAAEGDLGATAITSSKAVLSLDPATFQLRTSSTVAINTAYSSPTIYAAIEGKDRRNFVRVWANAVDVGAFELSSVPVEINSFRID